MRLGFQRLWVIDLLLLSSLCEDGVGGFLMLEYQKSSPTHPILTAQRSVPKKPRQINVALTPIKTSQLEEHLEDK